MLTKEEEKQGDIAMKMVNIFLESCEKNNIPIGAAQAALGEGWLRCLVAIGFTKQEFLDISQVIAEMRFK